MRNNIRERFSYLNRRKVAPQELQQMQVELVEESTLDINYVVLIQLVRKFPIFGTVVRAIDGFFF